MKAARLPDADAQIPRFERHVGILQAVCELLAKCRSRHAARLSAVFCLFLCCCPVLRAKSTLQELLIRAPACSHARQFREEAVDVLAVGTFLLYWGGRPCPASVEWRTRASWSTSTESPETAGAQ